MLYSIMIILKYSLQLSVGLDNLQNTPKGSFNWRCGESGTYDEGKNRYPGIVICQRLFEGCNGGLVNGSLGKSIPVDDGSFEEWICVVVCPGPVDLKLDVSSLSTVWFGCDIHVINLIWVWHSQSGLGVI